MSQNPSKIKTFFSRFASLINLDMFYLLKFSYFSVWNKEANFNFNLGSAHVMMFTSAEFHFYIYAKTY